MEQLAQELKISRRSAYYDVSKINVWLEQAGIPPLETERGRGLFVSPEYRSCIEQLLKEPAEDEVYIYSPEERVRLIILYIMDSPKSVFVEQLMEHCEVSRNTIFNDLKEATSQLQKYDLTLFYSNRTGYAVQGDPIRCRALFLFYFREMLPLYRDGVLDIFDRELMWMAHFRLWAHCCPSCFINRKILTFPRKIVKNGRKRRNIKRYGHTFRSFVKVKVFI